MAVTRDSPLESVLAHRSTGRCWDFVRSLPDRARYEHRDLLVPDLLVAEVAALRVFYAPFDWVNVDAKVALVGITPGWTQMEIACRTARAAAVAGAAEEEACRAAKSQASFAGPMRANLVHMLDALGLPQLLGVRSSIDLFGTALLHTTSTIRYPVFAGAQNRNYAGTSPTLVKSPFLMRFAREILAPELKAVPAAAIIPLGRRVEEVFQALEGERRVPPGRWLSGFPHPSGGNGHRVRLFHENRASLVQQLRRALRV